MTFSVDKLKEHHLLCLNTRPHTGNVDLTDQKAVRALLAGDAFVATDRLEVFGAAGVIPMWRGVGHGWAILTVPTGCKRLIWFTRQVRRYLGETGFRRVQTTVSTSFPSGVAWATHLLTFTPEGMLSQYDEAGHDHLMLARLRPEP